MTLEQFLALPDAETALEFDHGMVTQKMPPHIDHSGLQSELFERLNRIGRERQTGRAFPEVRMVTPNWTPVPDVSYFRKERIKPESSRRFGRIEIPPDIAIEIVSPDQSLGEMLRKCTRYANLGIPISLVVDPNDETIYDIRPGQQLRVLRGDDAIDLTPILSDFGVSVNELFGSIVDAWLLDDASAESAISQQQPTEPAVTDEPPTA